MQALMLVFLFAAALWAFILYRKTPQIQTILLGLGLGTYFVSHVFFGYPFFHIDAGPIPATVDRLLIGIVAFVWLIGVIQSRGSWVRLDWLDLIVMGWFLTIVASTLSNDWKFRDNLPLSRLLFFNFFPLLVYIILKHSPLTLGAIKCLNGAWVIIALALAVIAFLEWQGWHAWIYPRYIVTSPIQEFFGRGRGPLLNPIINGMLMTMGLVSVYLFALRSSLGMKIVWLAMACLMLVGVYATLTRSVWISAIGVLALLALSACTWRWRIQLMIAGSILGMFVYVFGADTLNNFKRDQYVSAREMSESAKLRPILAAVAWEMFKDHPVSGIGFGLYHKYKKPYHYNGDYELPLQTGLKYTQHNVFLVYLVETGIVGTSFLTGILFLVLRRSFDVWTCPPRDSQELRQVALVGYSLVLTYFVNGMFHDVSIIPMANCLILFGAGLIGQLSVPSSAFSGNTFWNYLRHQIGDECASDLSHQAATDS